MYMYSEGLVMSLLVYKDAASIGKFCFGSNFFMRRCKFVVGKILELR